MRILLINHYAGAPSLGMEYRPYYFAQEWQRCGHEVLIVAASFSHLRSGTVSCPTAATRHQAEGVTYLWLRTPRYVGNGLGRVRNIMVFLTRLWRESVKLARDFRPDAVIASSTYPADIFPARRIARRCGARLVFEVHDLWPLSPRILGKMPAWHPFIVAMQVAENHAYRWSDRVVSLLPNAAEHMVRHGMAPTKFAYIPNGVAIEEWEGAAGELPEEHARVLGELRRQGKFLVCYAGAHGLANALEYFVDAAGLLQGAGAQLVLVGNGPEKAALETRAREVAKDSVTFLPPLPRSSVRALLDGIDVAFLGWRRSPLYRFGISPNKLLDYMMAGKAVLHAVEAGNDPVREAGCGLSVEPENSLAIAEGIRYLMSLGADERAAMGARGRAYVVEHHDYKVLARRFLEVLSGD